MTFDWTEYLKLANELAKRNDEASLRSSISRAYYGVFCIARNILGYKNYRGKDVHQKVISELKQNKDRLLRKSGWNLDELRRKRNDADYQEEKTFDKANAEKMVNLAISIFATFKLLKGGPE
jgi:uncharacterized protein (UPF0332 family)